MEVKLLESRHFDTFISEQQKWQKRKWRSQYETEKVEEK